MGKADLAMASFAHTPERLEVTDGGYSTDLFSFELMYWKTKSQGFIYTMVLSIKAWIALTAIVILSSFGFLLIIQRQEQFSSNAVVCFANAFVINLKAYFGFGN